MAWAAEVHFLVGPYWRTFPASDKSANPSVAAHHAIRDARRRLPKGTRVNEVKVTLRRLAAVPATPS